MYEREREHPFTDSWSVSLQEEETRIDDKIFPLTGTATTCSDS